MSNLMKAGVAAIAACGLVGTAQASITITTGTSGTTYATTLNFDEVGGPTGSVPANSWTSLGLTALAGGAGNQTVAQFNTNPGFGWLGTGKAIYLPWGAFATFANDLTEFSAQYWDSSGPATFNGGGASVFVYKDGTQIASLFINKPAYGGTGSPWVNITTSGGSTFDEVHLVGFGFFPEAYLDNLSWNAVPAPASLGLASLAIFATARRRAR